MNALQADGPTECVLGIEPVHEKWAAWNVHRVDGNDPASLLGAFDAACAAAAPVGTPSVVICDTKIGFGVPLLETREKTHCVSTPTSGAFAAIN